MARALRSETLARDLSATARRVAPSLWTAAFHRFRKHKLASFGALILLTMVVAVLTGPFVYRVPIDEFDF
jgi:peptide/nickel transport system permease protein